jgi:hypothetical protein
MRRIDREAAHRLLDAYIDAQHVQAGCNDPDAIETAAMAASEAYRLLRGEIADEWLRERYASAGFTGRPFQLAAHSDDAQQFSREPCAPLKMMTPLEATARRRQVMQLVSDNEGVLPPGFAEACGAALLLLNMGIQTPLFATFRAKGLKNAARPEDMLDFARAITVGYLVGYDDAEAKFPNMEAVARNYSDLLDNMGWAAFDKRMMRSNYRVSYEHAKADGISDRIADRPKRYATAAQNDLVKLVEIQNRAAAKENKS